jgi:two-component system, LytTR family, sensor histidine kinase AlgZ
MLEDLADLFRALLAEPRTLVPLAQELQLARAYADIEAIRLGPRLRVRWDCGAAPGEALVPALILQPLLENAVRYGVEPLEQGAEVGVEARRDGDHLELVVRNPVGPPPAPGREGNHMALANIEERLALHFDAEARLRSYVSEAGEHVVRVRLPVISAPRPPGS